MIESEELSIGELGTSVFGTTFFFFKNFIEGDRFEITQQLSLINEYFLVPKHVGRFELNTLIALMIFESILSLYVSF